MAKKKKAVPAHPDPLRELHLFAYRVQSLAAIMGKARRDALDHAKEFLAEQEKQARFFIPRDPDTHSTTGAWHVEAAESTEITSDHRMALACFRTSLGDFVRCAWPDGSAMDREDRLDGLIQLANRLVSVVLPDARPPVAASKRVLLFDRGENPIVDGREVTALPKARYDVVKALLLAWPNGMNGPQLVAESKHTDAPKTLKLLAKCDGWKNVIAFPGREKSGGYRIL